MSQKLYKWEIALFCGFVIAQVWGGGVAREQAELADRVIRIHVIANSDTVEDQNLKLTVRDAVLEQVAQLGASAETTGELETLLSGQLPELEKAGEEVLRANGCPYTVTAALTDCWFPTREYEGFSFPAGEYRALKLTIGAGEEYVLRFKCMELLGTLKGLFLQD